MSRSIFRAGRRPTQAGFTLPELCTTLAITGILAALGAPGMTSFQDRAVVSAQSEGLMSALRLARQVAVSRGELVSVCAMDPGSAESGEPDCLARGKDWSAGWIVFVDREERGEIGASDQVISVQQAPTLRGGVVGTSRFMSFRASGVLLSPMAHFRVVPPSQPVADEDLPGAALVCVNKTGRPRLADEPECD
jgi:type IV fimbrial biogenesis protein FimT